MSAQPNPMFNFVDLSTAVRLDDDEQVIVPVLWADHKHVVLSVTYQHYDAIKALPGAKDLVGQDMEGDALIRISTQYVDRWLTEDEVHELAELRAIDEDMLQCAR